MLEARRRPVALLAAGLLLLAGACGIAVLDPLRARTSTLWLVGLCVGLLVHDAWIVRSPQQPIRHWAVTAYLGAVSVVGVAAPWSALYACLAVAGALAGARLLRDSSTRT